MRKVILLGTALGIASSYSPTIADEDPVSKSLDFHACGHFGKQIDGLPEDTNYLLDSPDRLRAKQVGILKITDGVGILNPPKPYPYSVSLNKVTSSEAEKLWGIFRNSDDGDFRTYDLWGIWAVDKREKNFYHLDAKFVNDKLKSYRVRGNNIVSPRWVEVN